MDEGSLLRCLSHGSMAGQASADSDDAMDTINSLGILQMGFRRGAEVYI